MSYKCESAAANYPLTASVALATAISSSYLSAAADVSSFFFLPFITLGAVLKPVADYLRLASSLSLAVLSALGADNLSVVFGAVSAIFFSSFYTLVVPAAVLSVAGGLIVDLAPPGANFLSTT